MATISIGITFFLITLILAAASYQQTTDSVTPLNAHSPSAPKPGRFNVLNSKQIILMEEFHPVDRKRTARQTPDDDDEGLGQDLNEENNDVIVTQPDGSGNEESNDEGIVPLVPGGSYDSEDILPSISSTISPNDVFAEDESSDDADEEEDLPSTDTEIRSSNSVDPPNGEELKEGTKTGEEIRSSIGFPMDLPDWEDVPEEPAIVLKDSKTEDTGEGISSNDNGLEDLLGLAGLIEAVEIVENSQTEDADEEEPSAAAVIPENDEDSKWSFGNSVENNNVEEADETTETPMEDEDHTDGTQDVSEASSSEQVDEVETANETSVPASHDGAVQQTDDSPVSEDQEDEDAAVNDVTTVSPNGQEKSTTTSPVTPRSSHSSGPQHIVLKFMREHVYIIVGFLLGVPAVVLLVYVLNVKRLRRHTGRLKVTPSHKKRPIESYPKNDCSNTTLVTEENELANSPTGKTPRRSSFNKSPYS